MGRQLRTGAEHHAQGGEVAARYLLVVFPVFILLAGVEDRRLQLAWFAGSIMFLTILLLAFETGQFVA